MAAQDDVDALVDALAEIILHQVSEAKKDGKEARNPKGELLPGLPWVNFYQKQGSSSMKLFKKLFKNGPTIPELANLIGDINRTLKVKYQANCDSWFIYKDSPSRCPIFESSPRMLLLSKKWNAALEKNNVTLEQVLTRQAPATDEGVDPTWHWLPLPLPSCKVSIKIGSQCWKWLLELIPFDDVFFPRDMRRLSHYLKMHLRHRLIENHTKLFSKHVAWFGRVPTADDPPQPSCILFNTQLLSKHDQSANLLLLCVPNTSYDCVEKPWFAMRVVLSTELNKAHIMRYSLSLCMEKIPELSLLHVMIDQIPNKDVLLVNHDNEVTVPDVLTMRSEDMMFDKTAPLEFGDFVGHMRRAEARWGRIPKEFVDLSDDELRSRAKWAIERARLCPNLPLVQWFCDKNSKQGYPQLVLPMTLLPYPDRTPRLGLVLEARPNELGIISYKVLTALSLDMVYSNMLVCQPQGGHSWLPTHLPIHNVAQGLNLGQPEELVEVDSADEEDVDNILGPVV